MPTLPPAFEIVDALTSNRTTRYLFFRPSEVVSPLAPPWPDTPPLNPDNLFKTTGEALMKTKYLVAEVKGLLRRTLTLPPDHPFCESCRSAPREAQALYALLLDYRGTHTHLEVDWHEGRARCRLVDARARQPDYTPPKRHQRSQKHDRSPAITFGFHNPRDRKPELSEAIVLELRRAFGSGEKTLKQLAKESEFNQKVVKAAIRGESWTHLPDAVPPSTNKTGIYRSKLTADQVIEMRRQYAAGELTVPAIAHRYGISTSNARKAINGENHPALPGATPVRPLTKLTEENVREIRRLSPALTAVSIARQYGVSKTAILAVLDRRIWKHVPREMRCGQMLPL